MSNQALDTRVKNIVLVHGGWIKLVEGDPTVAKDGLPRRRRAESDDFPRG